MPGQLRIRSTTTTPPSSCPNWMPSTVSDGISALGSACRQSMSRSVRPLARAVRTYCVGAPRAGSGAGSGSRARTVGIASVITGMIRCWMCSRGAPSGTRSRTRATSAARRRRRARAGSRARTGGMTNPTVESSPVTAVTTRLPRRTEATASNVASGSDDSSVTKVSSSEGSDRVRHRHAAPSRRPPGPGRSRPATTFSSQIAELHRQRLVEAEVLALLGDERVALRAREVVALADAHLGGVAGELVGDHERDHRDREQDADEREDRG